MAEVWALNFKGGNQYAEFDPLESQNNGSNVNWNLIFTVGNRDSEAVILGTNSGSYSDFIILRNANTLDYRVGGVDHKFNITNANIPAKYRLEMRWSGGDKNLSLYENETFLSTRNPDVASIIPAIYLARARTVYRDTRYDDYFFYEDLELSANTLMLNFSESDHAAGKPVILETHNNKIITTNYLPEDGSAWLYIEGSSGTEQPTTLAPTEQITQFEIVSVMGISLSNIIASESITQSQLVKINETTHLNAAVSEQKSQSQVITLEEAASIQAITCEQLAQAINADVSTINQSNSITAEQLSQSVTIDVDELSGTFVSVVHSEQLSQSTLVDINADSIINAVITQQLTQTSTQPINVDITLDAVICEQLTHVELITIFEQNISQQLSIDIDQITIEILTPTHEIEMLTPTYTIEHLH